MKNDYPEDRDINRRLLKAARRQFDTTRAALRAAVKRLNAGIENTNEDGKALTTPISAFNKSIQSVIDIEANLAKRSYEQRSGGEGACPLDLEAARREVIERLVKLAQSRGGGGTA
ncbi:MAG: hypothetical protein V3V13_12735 [Paracoccaceae bacterium]